MNTRISQFISTGILVAAVFLFLEQRRQSLAIEEEIAKIEEISKSLADVKAREERESMNVVATVESPSDLGASANLRTGATPPLPAPSSKNEPFFNSITEMSISKLKEEIDLTEEQAEQIRDVSANFFTRVGTPEELAAASEEYHRAMTEIIGEDKISLLRQKQLEKFEAVFKREREGDLAFYRSKLGLNDAQVTQLDSVLEQGDKIFRDQLLDLGEKQMSILSNPSIATDLIKEIRDKRRESIAERSRQLLNDQQYNSFLELLNNSPSTNPFFGAF